MKKNNSQESFDADVRILDKVKEVIQVNTIKSPWLESFVTGRDPRLAYISVNPNYCCFYKKKPIEISALAGLHSKISNNHAIPVDLLMFPPEERNYYGGTRIIESASLVSSNLNSIANLVDHAPAGVTSRKSSSRIKLAINWLHFISNNQKVYCEELKRNVKFKLNLITLTLPCSQIKSYTLPCGKVLELNDYSKIFPASNLGFGKLQFNYTDKFIKHDLLNHFLTLLRRNFHVQSYVWRAETQANGNIHFHITTNKFVYLSDIRTAWNRVLSKTSMLDDYRDKFKDMSFNDYKSYRCKFKAKKKKDLLKAYSYGVKTKWSDPNTTDIHAVYKIKNLAAYLAEYFTKENSGRRLVDGCLWRLSKLLSMFKKDVQLAEGDVGTELGILWKKNKSRVKIKDFVSVFCYTIDDIRNIVKDSVIVKSFIKYRDSIFEEYQKQHILNLT